MSFALQAALGVRKRLGPRAGLHALKPLWLQLAGRERGDALLALLDCAAAAGDRDVFNMSCLSWSAFGGGDYYEQVSAVVRRRLPQAPQMALGLAEAEVRRSPEHAGAVYLLARIKRLASLPEADVEAAFRRALVLACRPPRELFFAYGIASTMLAEGIALPVKLPKIDDGPLGPQMRLSVAHVRLKQGGRYARVSALDLLVAIVTEAPSSAVARRALRIGALHADHANLLEIEEDRLHTLFRAHPEGIKASQLLRQRRRMRAWNAETSGRLNITKPALESDPYADYLDLAAKVLRDEVGLGNDQETETLPIRTLRIAAALRNGTLNPEALEEWSEAIGAARESPPGKRAPSAWFEHSEPVLVIAAAALRATEPRIRQIGLALTATIARASPTARRGWLRLTYALTAAKATWLKEVDSLPFDVEQVVRLFRERAYEAREPGAGAAVAAQKRAAGWAAFLGGDPDAESLLKAARVYSKQ